MSRFPDDINIHHMKHAIALARRGIGVCAPNPSVGCVIVKNGRIVAAARTADGGRPHAEALALEIAGECARGADVYVTLEPCAHHGKTPPCAESLVQAGVSRVIVGVSDPDDRVCGKGVDTLRSAGITVVEGFVDKRAYAVTQGFLTRLTQGRPFVALKTATTLDGKIATSKGESKWITGVLARRKVHQLRSHYDAILCGIGTVLADDPLLTTRVNGLHHKAPRIILDSHLRMPMNAQLVHTAKDAPIWVFYKDDADGKSGALQNAGMRLFSSDMCLESILKVLAAEGVSSLFVEGGGRVHSSFLKGGLVDKLYWFRAPKILGDSARGVLPDYHTQDLSDASQMHLKKICMLGEDRLEIYTRKS